ncbi:MAG: DUF58 domain-containing protein [Anaerolineales bacterium]|nr:DUF58 domain-containing protein [Anaerolineales bacterium]
MLTELAVFFLLLLAVASIVDGGFAFTILYLFFGTALFGWLWARQTGKHIRFTRRFERRAFWGETIPVRIEIENSGLLPVPWLHLHESLPVDIAPEGPSQHVISLGPHGRSEVGYVLHGRKRGYYTIGPLFSTFGDVIGLARPQERGDSPDHMTVFPKIIPLTSLHLPSRSPHGTLRHHQPIFEDPSRILNKRDYVAGDSLRRVDWKATAATGRMQVKQYEPSIALETAIFLNLNEREYASMYRIDATELAIVIAASIANWVVLQKQSVGLVTNGIDPHLDGQLFVPPVPTRKGRAHLLHLLETLARLQPSDRTTLVEMLGRQSPNLPWGTTLVIVTGHVDEALFDELFQVQRRGQNVVVVLAGRAMNIKKALQQAEQFGLPMYAFQDEKALDLWRR